MAQTPISDVWELRVLINNSVRWILLQESVSLSENVISKRLWGASSRGIPWETLAKGKNGVEVLRSLSWVVLVVFSEKNFVHNCGFCLGTNFFVKSVLPWLYWDVSGVWLLLWLCTSNEHRSLKAWNTGLAVQRPCTTCACLEAWVRAYRALVLKLSPGVVTPYVARILKGSTAVCSLCCASYGFLKPRRCSFYLFITLLSNIAAASEVQLVDLMKSGLLCVEYSQ